MKYEITQASQINSFLRTEHYPCNSFDTMRGGNLDSLLGGFPSLLLFLQSCCSSRSIYVFCTQNHDSHLIPIFLLTGHSKMLILVSLVMAALVSSLPRSVILIDHCSQHFANWLRTSPAQHFFLLETKICYL